MIPARESPFFSLFRTKIQGSQRLVSMDICSVTWLCATSLIGCFHPDRTRFVGRADDWTIKHFVRNAKRWMTNIDLHVHQTWETIQTKSWERRVNGESCSFNTMLNEISNRRKILLVTPQLRQLRKESLKKIQAWTGFEPMTSAMPVQCSTNWELSRRVLSHFKLYKPLAWGASVIDFTSNNKWGYFLKTLLQSIDLLPSVLWFQCLARKEDACTTHARTWPLWIPVQQHSVPTLLSCTIRFSITEKRSL